MTSVYQYYLDVEEFVTNLVELPVISITGAPPSASIAARAPLYKVGSTTPIGTCSASFLCLNDGENVFVDISNFINIENGLIVSWFTPTTIQALELDQIIYAMITQAIVRVSTKIGNPNNFFSRTYSLTVTTNGPKIFFLFEYVPLLNA
uniref:Uncharacterized protein n=1 Tax=viral metagenome TaxID=1070528 RepID=A0A6C0D1N9_9ZZZZ